MTVRSKPESNLFGATMCALAFVIAFGLGRCATNAQIPEPIPAEIINVEEFEALKVYLCAVAAEKSIDERFADAYVDMECYNIENLNAH